MARTCWIKLTVSADERLRIAAAASALGMSVAGWVRQQAVTATAGALPRPAPLQAPRSHRPSAGRRHAATTVLFAEEFAALVEHARACELTVSSFIRELLLGRRPITRQPLLRSAIVAVNRAGNHLDQLVQLGAGGILLAPDLLSAVAALRQEIGALLDLLLTADAAAPPGSPQ